MKHLQTGLNFDYKYYHVVHRTREEFLWNQLMSQAGPHSARIRKDLRDPITYMCEIRTRMRRNFARNLNPVQF